MVLTIKHRMQVYRRFEKDVWGLAFSSMNPSHKVTEFFFGLYLNKQAYKREQIQRYIYRVDLVDPNEHKKLLKPRFVTLRLVKLFYLTLKYKQFRLFARLAARKDGFFQSNFCLLLEGRISSFIYRTNLLYSMFEIIDFVKRSNVKVNGSIINYVNYIVKIGDIVTFLPRSYRQFYYCLVAKFRVKSFVFNMPRFLFVSYKLFFAFMLKYPNDKDLAFPIELDIYRATSFY